MSKRLGEYVPLSATYADDDAVLSLSPMAELLYVRTLAIAAQHPSDGYLTEGQVLRLAARGLGTDGKVKKLVSELCGSGLWLAESGGYVIRGWLKWNKSAEDLGREKARDRDRKRDDRREQAGEEPFLTPEIKAEIQQESAMSPGGHVTESGTTPNGVQPESEHGSSDVQPVSGGNPSSRALARTGVRRAVSSKDRNDGTERHVTLPEMPDDPLETDAARANRLARVYTDQVRVSNFPAVAKIVRKAVDAKVPDETIITGLKKLVAENRGLTTETLRVAIYGPPKGGRQQATDEQFDRAMQRAEARESQQ